MRKRALTAVLLAGAVALPPAVAVADAAAADRPSRALKKLRLQAFDDCSELVAYARRYAPRVDDYYGPGAPPQPVTVGPVPPPAPGGGTGGGAEGGGGATDTPTATPQTTPVTGDSSTTNVQEQGVDEPDIVKTDGAVLFALTDGALHAVDARASEPKLLDSLGIDGYGHELLVHGKRALVMSTVALGVPPGPVAPATSVADAYYGTATLLTEVDVSDPGDLKVVRTETIDGAVVSSRLTGETARVVISTPPAAFAPGVPDTAERRLAGWIPKSTVVNKRTGGKRTRRIVRCGAVRHPRTFSGLDMLTVLTIDMSRGLPAVDADALMTGADDVYASTSGLYVATRRWTPPPADASQVAPRGHTAIHRFDTKTANATAYRASGQVPGYLLNQWSMSEHEGVLRVASTREPEWWEGGQRSDSESYMTTLAERDGALVELGRVGGLGRGERIYAVRMIGDTGYVVTFRQTDPLYTIDLSTPTAPKVLGELKILGYSAYLHPIGDNLLLGVGQDATAQGRQLGTQVSIFDVGDAANPRLLHQRRLASGSSSDVEWNHHAFLYWDPHKLVVIPLDDYSREDTYFSGAVGLVADRTGIAERGRIVHDWGTYPGYIQRSVVVGERLFTVSTLGVKASDLGSFADVGHVAWPVRPGS